MKTRTKKLSRSAMIAAIYVLLCFIFKPLSFLSVQLRISEALTVLPIFMPEAPFGLFTGCLIANLLCGSSVALIDVFLGSLTTFISALLTRVIYTKFGNIPLSLIPPVLLNSLIVGSYIPLVYSSPQTPASIPIILFSIVTVFFGELISVYAIGLPFAKALNKTNFLTFL